MHLGRAIADAAREHGQSADDLVTRLCRQRRMPKPRLRAVDARDRAAIGTGRAEEQTIRT